MKHKIMAIIPARYSSSRFPGKPLIDICGKPMIEHVYGRASHAVGNNVWVATDDKRIFDAVRAFGGNAVFTSSECRNGTERVAEAYEKLGIEAEVIINVQGDEPCVESVDICNVAKMMAHGCDIATIAYRFKPENGFEALFDPNRVKLVMDKTQQVLYFSRSIIPYVRDVKWQEWISATEFFIHGGLYAFTPNSLSRAIEAEPSPIEKAEKLEQLRWIYDGLVIKTAVSDGMHTPIDTPEDLKGLSFKDCKDPD